MCNNVLIVEDDKHLCDFYTKVLRRLGLRTVVYDNPEDALRVLAHIDLIILDLQLPKMSGADFLHVVREQGSLVPVIIATGSHTKEAVIKSLGDLGLVDILAKPFGAKDLLGAVKKAAKLSDNLRFIDSAITRLKHFSEKIDGNKPSV